MFCMQFSLFRLETWFVSSYVVYTRPSFTYVAVNAYPEISSDFNSYLTHFLSQSSKNKTMHSEKKSLYFGK